MRIVDTDNFGGDYPNERFVAGTESTPLPLEEAKRIADEKNDRYGPYANRYWKVVPDDYILQPGFEP